MHPNKEFFDGNWVDICSFISGIAYLAYCHKKDTTGAKLISKKTGIDFANGAALFPLLILAFSVVSSSLVAALIEASKMSLSVAGVFALLAILEE